MTWRLCANPACAAAMGELPDSEFMLVPHRGICDACVRESGVGKVHTRCVDCGKATRVSVRGVGLPRCATCAPYLSRRVMRSVA